MTSAPAEPAAIGLDIGGTSTRAVVLDRSGRRLGFGTAGGGNISSHGRDAAFASIFAAVDAALAAVDPAAIAYGLIGSAGSGHLLVPEIAAELDRRWNAAGMRCPYEVESDAVVAFVAGTDRPDGTLILAGTGALASGLIDRRMTRTVDGHGWLLGDLGSAFWLGREAVVHTLHVWDVGQEPGPLARAVLDHFRIAPPAVSGHRNVQADVEVAVYRDAPIRLAALAPLVTSLVDRDQAAAGIVATGADHLLRAATAVRSAEDAPVVLAGSLLTTETPLAAAVRERIGASWPTATVGTAHDGAAAAAWLALVRGGLVDDGAAPAVHRMSVRR